MAGQKLTDKNKKIALGAVLGVLGLVVIYQAFLSEPPPKKKLTSSNSSASGSPSPAPVDNAVKPASTGGQPAPPSPDSAVAKQIEIQRLLSDTSPLDFSMMDHKGMGAGPSERNIFAWPPPPKPPLPVYVPPPPIALKFMQPQSAVAGTPKAFKLTVTGTPFPDDAQIFWNQRPKPTKKTPEGNLTTDIAPGDYNNGQTVIVEVKSPSDPKMISNGLPFVVEPSPNPPFKFVGRIGELAVLEIGEGQNKQYFRSKRGEVLQTMWRIDSFNDTAIEFTDLQHEIKKRVAMEEKK